jgi:hypothetical protein
MKIFDQIESRRKAREQEVFNLFQALSLACRNANEHPTPETIRRADEFRRRLVNMGELPETSR